MFVHGNRGSENRIYEIDDEQLSFCSCVNDGGDDGCDDDDDDDEDGRSDCCARAASDCCAKPAETPDYERDAIRDDLMAMKGGVKLLGEQNAYLLSRLNGSVILRTVLPARSGSHSGRFGSNIFFFFGSTRKQVLLFHSN